MHEARLLVGALLLSVGCASQRPPSPAAPEGGGAEANPEKAPLVQESSAETPADPEEAHPLEDDREPDPKAALPRLTMRHLGMHIGGPDNSPEAKRPWFSDIEARVADLLACYRLVDVPERGGSYGVDLYVNKQGAVEVRASRQKLGGEEFDSCMKQAFSQTAFHKPAVPTVFSYSLLFSLSDAEALPEGAL